MSTTYSCGCVNDLHPDWGVAYCVSKCASHQHYLVEHPSSGPDYYRKLGVLGDKDEVVGRNAAELEEALGHLPRSTSNHHALEIGCGVSLYVPVIRNAGYHYAGIEIDLWAAQKTAATYNVPVSILPFEDYQAHPGLFGLILSAHSLEHMADAPAMLAKMHTLLCPGGHLVLIVPDDEDPTNPDHRWFFTEASLHQLLSKVGFRVQRHANYRRVSYENFMYTLAIKDRMPPAS